LRKADKEGASVLERVATNREGGRPTRNFCRQIERKEDQGWDRFQDVVKRRCRRCTR